MSCRAPYIKSGQCVVVLDKYGNRLVEYLNSHDTCRQVFFRKLNMMYHIDLNGGFQLFVDGKRIS